MPEPIALPATPEEAVQMLLQMDKQAADPLAAVPTIPDIAPRIEANRLGGIAQHYMNSLRKNLANTPRAGSAGAAWYQQAHGNASGAQLYNQATEQMLNRVKKGDVDSFIDQHPQLVAGLARVLGGAGVGAGFGSLVAGKGRRGRGAMTGALMGAGVGAGVHASRLPSKEYESALRSLTEAVQPVKKVWELAKNADAPYPGMSSFATQQYAPIAGRRELDSDEQDEIDRNSSRWLPKLFPSYATPNAELLSSPWKTSLMMGGGAGAVGAGIGAALGNKHDMTIPGAAIGGLAAGLPTALLSYFGKRQDNENTVETMRRLPKGSTMRDYLADPVVQTDINRRLYAAGGGHGDNALLAALMLKNSGHTKQGATDNWLGDTWNGVKDTFGSAIDKGTNWVGEQAGQYGLQQAYNTAAPYVKNMAPWVLGGIGAGGLLGLGTDSMNKRKKPIRSALQGALLGGLALGGGRLGVDLWNSAGGFGGMGSSSPEAEAKANIDYFNSLAQGPNAPSSGNRKAGPDEAQAADEAAERIKRLHGTVGSNIYGVTGNEELARRGAKTVNSMTPSAIGGGIGAGGAMAYNAYRQNDHHLQTLQKVLADDKNVAALLGSQHASSPDVIAAARTGLTQQFGHNRTAARQLMAGRLPQTVAAYPGMLPGTIGTPHVSTDALRTLAHSNSDLSKMTGRAKPWKWGALGFAFPFLEKLYSGGLGLNGEQMLELRGATTKQ